MINNAVAPENLCLLFLAHWSKSEKYMQGPWPFSVTINMLIAFFDTAHIFQL